MSDDWKDNEIDKSQPIVVCAACRYGMLILCSARHWDKVMMNQYYLAKATGAYPGIGRFAQGFINQFGDFLTREEAMEVVLNNGQPLNLERNDGNKKLFSEGLY